MERRNQYVLIEDAMIVYKLHLYNSTGEILQLMNTFNKVAGYKIISQN